MSVHLTRDSVAMGDDVDAPHEATADVPDAAAVADLVQWIVDHYYGASVAGGSTWVLRDDKYDGRALAVVARPSGWFRLVADPGPPLDPEATYHLDYALAVEPGWLLERLREDPLASTRSLRDGKLRG